MRSTTQLRLASCADTAAAAHRPADHAPHRAVMRQVFKAWANEPAPARPPITQGATS